MPVVTTFLLGILALIAVFVSPFLPSFAALLVAFIAFEVAVLVGIRGKVSYAFGVLFIGAICILGVFTSLSQAALAVLPLILVLAVAYFSFVWLLGIKRHPGEKPGARRGIKV